MRSERISAGVRATLAIFALILFVTESGVSQETVLHSFYDKGRGGFGPAAGLISDASGNLYGTASGGGSDGSYGTVFELTPKAGGGWMEKVLHAFDYSDGYLPEAGLIFDDAGNLYGTTAGGGAHNYGAVFELKPGGGGSWTEKVLHSFGGKDGQNPEVGLIFDAHGNLYGTTAYGGAYDDGTVFELTRAVGGSWRERVLYSFDAGEGMSIIPSGLILDASGNLYGMTGSGPGTVFELMPGAGGSWTETVLHQFTGGPNDGYGPLGGLIVDAAGNLYGTTGWGGAYSGIFLGWGTVFELSPATGGGWTEQILHSFNDNGDDGWHPETGVIFDAAGNLYGTTLSGGAYVYGTVFQLTPTTGGGWTETVLHGFDDNGTDGQSPSAGVILDSAGNLYGTTASGGAYGYGTVFEITP